MVRAAKKVAVVTIAEKFNTVQKIKICDLADVDYLVTELPPDSPILAGYGAAEKPVLL
jgi:DeoR/GlpR family transcriptional regulator of sugar metabolism